MRTTHQVETYVVLKPHELGPRDKMVRTVMGKAKTKLEGACYDDLGVVVEISEVTCSQDFTLSRTNEDIIVKAQARVTTVKPHEGMKSEAYIVMVYPEGVFLQILGLFDGLLPLERLMAHGYEYRPEECAFARSDGAPPLKAGGTIPEVAVTHVFFDQSTYNTICDLPLPASRTQCSVD